MNRHVATMTPGSRTVIAALLALVAAPALAGSDGQWTSGNEAWEKVCARCHAAGVGPELRGRKLPAVYVKVIARNGFRAMPAMPASALDEATLDQIAAMIEASPPPPGAAAATPATGSRNP